MRYITIFSLSPKVLKNLFGNGRHYHPNNLYTEWSVDRTLTANVGVVYTRSTSYSKTVTPIQLEGYNKGQ